MKKKVKKVTGKKIGNVKTGSYASFGAGNSFPYLLHRDTTASIT